MQAIIMAAGKGSRLGSLTENIPKSFLEIKGIKMIEYNISMLHAFGIKDIIIVTGYQSERFEELTKKIDGVQCVFNPFYEQVNVLGSFYMAKDFLYDDFVYLHADTLCAPEIFESMLHEEGDMILPVEYGLCDEEAMKVKISNGKVIEINKTMPCDSSEGEFIGIAKISKGVIEDLRKATTQIMKEKEFSSYFEGAIQRIIDMNSFYIKAISTQDYFWSEVDFIEDYQRASAGIPDSLIKIVKEES
ncbi:phosphocholine cytidylyltransferase family protein [Kineothrix sp. MB12-C1]|uniref:phosphocholine cytidylyltransferase family protein n=1 Tax=Kineothrix sp. MB12-C1 TaxID=3070215 RepID=UPI0027D226C6|nr:phosphocholine cytidylyltransferase family protein [Kineothrix sp. MB12-C1]WMC93870.1 phosphocholine cytidylyltransferase family protein [Kineothrix sp. MB12-C1]